jgi:ssDNA-binding Zn-finger/Zn-ribbon topoisomerase 1
MYLNYVIGSVQLIRIKAMIPKPERKNKLATLVRIEGFDGLTELLQKYVGDSVCLGICTTPGCNYTTEVEPDCAEGYCDRCDKQTVVSAMRLAGMI